MYEGTPKLSIPEKAKIVCFEDDIAIVVVAKLLKKVVHISSNTIGTVQRWLESVVAKRRRKQSLRRAQNYIETRHQIPSHPS